MSARNRDHWLFVLAAFFALVNWFLMWFGFPYTSGFRNFTTAGQVLAIAMPLAGAGIPAVLMAAGADIRWRAIVGFAAWMLAMGVLDFPFVCGAMSAC